ncbi:MAG: type IX secretion system membrane protein PorP/SprF [Ginsengibacter sp.]
MKKFCVIVVVLFSSLAGSAQQQPQYTQYIINNYIINPALSGIENYTDVKISHRHQWVGINDAPITTYLTIQGPIGKKDDRTSATSFDIPGENPRGKSYWQTYTAPPPHHGIGLKVINDRTGPLNNLSAYGSYAYHIGLSPRTSLAAGFEVGIKSLSLHTRDLIFDPDNPFSVDPAVGNSEVINRIKPDMGAGLWLYSADFFAGVSAQQIIPQTIYFSQNTVKTSGFKLVPHLFVTAGYRFQLNDDIFALPSIMIKYVQPLPLQADVNIKLQYRDFLWVGGSYRTFDGFAGLAGINVSNTFNISYAYDYTTSLLGTISKGTHEIVLGFLINNRYDDSCPRNVW